MKIRELTDKEKLEIAIAEVLGLDVKRTSRIILDLDAREPFIQVYVEMYALNESQAGLLDVDWARGLAGADVVTVGDE